MDIDILDFGPTIISGRLSGTGERPEKIQLSVDGCSVAGNWGIPSQGGNSQSFRFNLSGIWNYVGETAQFRVSIGDNYVDLPLPAFASKPTLSLAELQEKLATQHVFNEKGKLQLSKTVDMAWQKKMFMLYDEMRSLLDLRGIDLVVMYGTLLGAFREKDFIGHDHDFDAGYISSHSDPVEVRRELVSVAETLIRRGFRVSCKGTCIWVTDPRSEVTIDVFHTYFDSFGKLQFPFGVCGIKSFTRDDFEGYREIELAGRNVLAASNTEALVEYIYGPHWGTPNPGHNWTLDRTEHDKHARPTRWGRSSIYWTDQHVHSRVFYPSDFAEFVSRSHYLRRSLIDLGCGNGRDTLHFATNQSCVIGIDTSAAAIEAARAVTKARPCGSALSFVRGDATNPDVLRGVIAKARAVAGKSGVTLYARFLLHVLSEDGASSLLKSCSEQMEKGDSIALEFRTDLDEKIKKAHEFRHRRFIRADDLVKHLEELDLEVVVRIEGTGLSPYMNENPQLCRIIAVKRIDAAIIPTSQSIF